MSWRFVLTTVVASVLAAAGCRRPAPSGPDSPAPRVVSFSPAITGMLFEMNLGRHVVGVTTFCTVPAGERDIPVVGDRARVSAEPILAVRPDVILVQQNPADFAAVTNIAPRVRIEHFTIESLADIAAAIERIGAIAGDQQAGLAHKEAFLSRLEAVRRRTAGLARPRVLFLLDFDKPSTGGAGTFISEMIDAAGGLNAAAAAGYSGWRTLNRENVISMAPEVLVCQVSPGQEAAAADYWRTLGDLPAVRAGRVHVVTDSRWTVPSIWSARFAEELASMIHPDQPAKEAHGG